MEKNLISEISRIHELMGSKNLLLEQGAFARFLVKLAAAAPHAIPVLEKTFMTLRKVGTKLTDEQIYKTFKELQNTMNFTDEELETIVKSFKSDKDLRNILDNSDDFLNDLKKLDLGSAADDVPEGLKVLEKFKNLTDEEISTIVKNTTKKLLSNLDTGLAALYNNVVKAYGQYLEKIISKGTIPIRSTEEVYNLMDDAINQSLIADVKAGKISQETAEEFYEVVTKEIRCCSDIPGYLEKIKTKGLDAGLPPRNTKPSFGDAPSGLKSNNLALQNEDYVRWRTNKKINELKKTPNYKSASDFEKQKMIAKAKDELFTEFKGNENLTKNLSDDEIKQTVKTESDNLDDTVRTPQEVIGDDVADEINKLFNDTEYQAASPLEQAAKQQELKAKLKTKYQNSPVEGVTTKEVDEIVETNFNKSLNEIQTTYEAGFFKKLQVGVFGTLPGIDEIVSLLNRMIQGLREINFESFEAFQKQLNSEVEDIIIKIEKGEFSESWYREVADKIKVANRDISRFNQSFEKILEDFRNKIKAAMGNDEGKYKGIIDNINSGESLDEFFIKVNQYFDPGIRVRETWEIARDASYYFRLKADDLTKSALKYSKGFGRRWLNFILGGTLRTFKEWAQRLVQKRKLFMVFGKKVAGYNWASYVDMWFRIWLVSNVIAPAIYEIPLQVVLWAVAQGFSLAGRKPVMFEKYYEQNLDTIIWNDYKDLFPEAFGPFFEIYQEIRGTQDENLTTMDWVYETINFIIPFNSKVDDMYYFLSHSKELSDKVDDTKIKLGKKLDEIEKKAEGKGKNLIKRLRKEYDEKVIETLPEGHQQSLMGIKFDPNLTEDAKDLLQSYSNGSEDTKDMWIEDPADPSIKYTLVHNPNLYVDGDFDKGLLSGNKSSDLGRKEGFLKWKDGDKLKSLKDLHDVIKTKVTESFIEKIKNLIMENTGKKFGEDIFKHWKGTFVFKTEDKKNPGQYKKIKINMEDVMDRIDHYRKKYDEDDAFVRAVVDTHDDVVKIMYTKGLADIHESASPRGLALVLRTLNESRGEMEIFSVARPANGNWFLVKGDFTQSQLANMDLEKKEPKDKEEKKEVSGSEELKKKEKTAIETLKTNEREGLDELPKKTRQKVLEKMGKGWTTESLPEFLKKLVSKSEINSIFNDKIEIFKLLPNDETFNSIVDNSSRVFIKRGFCRSLYVAAENAHLSNKQEMVVNHILKKCDTKFAGKLGVRNF